MQKADKKLAAILLAVIAAAVIILIPKDKDAIKTSDDEEIPVTTTVTTTTSPDTQGETTPETSAVTTDGGEGAAPVTTTAPTDVDKPTDTTTAVKTDETDKGMTVATTSAAVSGVTSVTSVATTVKKPTATTKVTTTKKTTTTTKVTTTQKPPDKPLDNNSPSGTPVALHGQLSVKGTKIVDQNGNTFQLRGMSTHGIGWFPDAVNKNNFKVLRDDWGANAIRLAMYVEESWGGSESCYLADKDRNYKLVTNGIDYAIELGMYVIVDWHVLNPGDPSKYTADAKAFFAKIAKEYGDCPNIIYELCNEPNGGVTWNGTIKPYCEAVTKEIRKYDSDAIIVCGTPTWSQDIHNVVGNTLSDKNTVYALHFYANTHTDWLRNRLKDCVKQGLPVLVTEFGTCDASGNGGYNESETKKWLNLLDELDVGYFNWALCNKDETCSALSSSANLGALKSGESQLSQSGKFIRRYLRSRAGL